MDEQGSNGEQRTIRIPDPVIVRDLAVALEMKPFEVIRALMELNLFVTQHHSIPFETAAALCLRYGVVAHKII